ncbi:uncharacterized protein [Centruroides vittatus]|uniref:uncharacterized protein n=1 Tax=Centruroides vittatus TaxID=120091 RepID=UPI00350F6475
MSTWKKGILPGYAADLKDNDMIEYKKKISFIGWDPYEMKPTDFSSNDLTTWPTIEHGDIVNYLVLTTNAVTLDQMKAYKSLDAHNYLTSGFIHRDILSRAVRNDLILLVGKVRIFVNHSQNLRQPALVVWVLAKKNGEAITGHCNCMAGQSSSCSHVGAILFAIAEGIKIRKLPDMY